MASEKLDEMMRKIREQKGSGTRKTKPGPVRDKSRR